MAWGNGVRGEIDQAMKGQINFLAAGLTSKKISLHSPTVPKKLLSPRPTEEDSLFKKLIVLSTQTDVPLKILRVLVDSDTLLNITELRRKLHLTEAVMRPHLGTLASEKLIVLNKAGHGVLCSIADELRKSISEQLARAERAYALKQKHHSPLTTLLVRNSACLKIADVLENRNKPTSVSDLTRELALPIGTISRSYHLLVRAGALETRKDPRNLLNLVLVREKTRHKLQLAVQQAKEQIELEEQVPRAHADEDGRPPPTNGKAKTASVEPPWMPDAMAAIASFRTAYPGCDVPDDLLLSYAKTAAGYAGRKKDMIEFMELKAL